MKAGTLTKIAQEILDYVTANFIDANDDFVAPRPEEYAGFTVAIEQILVKHGVSVPGNVDKIVKMLPVIFVAFGE